MSYTSPTPGSNEALDAGCLCAVLDNVHGHGANGTCNLPMDKKEFWINADCPLHGTDGAQEIQT